ncbi:conjugal transfer protein TraM [Zophobihabitans entericus]|uniref:Conjugal transfer protein TraM n=1 Tax=Zophobihabitans entericus TaxID=1635327 RepID=A0A6G9IE73_9GAMM|nr:conjugal transfer protein TraM [Zophobihabitans entericus]QIQ22535.1 conjugal transfer protein TraM [Zophobihabitans entericus]
MRDKQQELIELIARKNNVLIGSDDPILMLLTANEFIITENTKALSEALSGYSSKIEVISSQWDSLASKKAEKILNASLNASKQVLNEHLEESASKIKALISSEILAAKIEIEREKKRIGLMSLINTLSALLIFVSVIVYLVS